MRSREAALYSDVVPSRAREDGLALELRSRRIISRVSTVLWRQTPSWYGGKGRILATLRCNFDVEHPKEVFPISSTTSFSGTPTTANVATSAQGASGWSRGVVS